jgi:hypothetical protein
MIDAAISNTGRRDGRGHAGTAEHAPLPWPAAALAIGSLSAGLWLGIGWLVATLL